MSVPTAKVNCHHCKKSGIMEVYGPDMGIELPSGWLFLEKVQLGWRVVVNSLTNNGIRYKGDLRLFCSKQCAYEFAEQNDHA